jgi:hypothetical protein
MVKAGRALLRRDTDLADEGDEEESETFVTPRVVSAVAPFVDEWAEGIPACTRWSSWVTSSALP